MGKKTMTAVFILLALSAVIGFALSAFAWWPVIVGSCVTLATLSATVLQWHHSRSCDHHGLLDDKPSCLRHWVREKRFARYCNQGPAEAKGPVSVLLIRLENHP
jgi:hypothetical protein